MSEGQGMAKRDEFAGFFCGENASKAGGSADGSFGDGLGFDEFEGGLLEADFAASDGFAEHNRFGGDIHHRGLAATVYMGKPFHEVAGVRPVGSRRVLELRRRVSILG